MAASKEQENLTIIESTDRTEIISQLTTLGVKGAHFTNGTYMLEADKIIPTTLTGFKHATTVYPKLPLVVAVNSDKSLRALGKEKFEPQIDRARKVAEPLAELFPENQVIILFYDETTPNDLYEALKKHNMTRTLHKWGYGTAPGEPKIEGAEHFDRAYSHPLLNDEKPVCYDGTEKSSEEQAIKVVNLYGKLIAKDGLLFAVPESLQYLQSESLKTAATPKLTGATP